MEVGLLRIAHQSRGVVRIMKNNTLRYVLMSTLLIITMAGCGPSYVGVGTGYGYGPTYGYYAPRPYYAYPQRPVYVAPPRVYYNRPRYYRSPQYSYRYSNPRSYNGGRRR